MPQLLFGCITGSDHGGLGGSAYDGTYQDDENTIELIVAYPNWSMRTPQSSPELFVSGDFAGIEHDSSSDSSGGRKTTRYMTHLAAFVASSYSLTADGSKLATDSTTLISSGFVHNASDAPHGISKDAYTARMDIYDKMTIDDSISNYVNSASFVGKQLVKIK